MYTLTPPKFDYKRASSVEEACKLLATTDGAKVIAGGQSLLVAMRLRLASPAVLVDIGHISDLGNISEEGMGLNIGATCTHSKLARSKEVMERFPILCEAAARVGDEQVRNRGTIGGSISHADPAGNYAPVLTALNAKFAVVSASNRRTIAASNFFEGPYTTVLNGDELVEKVVLEKKLSSGTKEGHSFMKFSTMPQEFATVNVASVVAIKDGKFEEVTVALGALLPKPRIMPELGESLIGKATTAENIRQASQKLQLGSEIISDYKASAQYRTHIAKVLVARSLLTAVNRATGAE